jgi:putative transposase
LTERQLQQVLKAYVLYFNHARPHQGICQQIPDPENPSLSVPPSSAKLIVQPILGGLHHAYRRAA